MVEQLLHSKHICACENQNRADVAEQVDAADFNWSAHGEIRGVEPLKVGER